MKLKTLFIIICFPLTIVNPLYSQSEIKDKEKKKTFSLYFHYGFGNYTVKDNYISDNKYVANSSNYYNIGWNKNHERYKYLLTYTFSKGKAKNGIVSANIKDFMLCQGFLYKINSIGTNDNLNLYIGPMTDFFLHYRTQNVASSRLTQSYSVALLISASLASEIEYKPFDKLFFRNNIKLNIISVAARLPNYILEDYKIVQVRTPFSTTLLQNTITLNYRFIPFADLQLGYNLQVLNFTDTFSSTKHEEIGWSKIYSTSNIFLIGIKLWI